jgi:hypothetical protein
MATLTEEEKFERIVRWIEKLYWIGGFLLLLGRNKLGLLVISLTAGLLWVILLGEGNRATTITVFRKTAWVVAIIGSARAAGVV